MIGLLSNRKTLMILPIGVVILLSGCGTPDPHPFQQYAAALKEAGNGLDAVLLQDVGWSRDKYIESILNGSVSLEHTAVLDRKGPFTVAFPVTGGVTNEPTFYRLEDVRLTLLNLNDAAEKYANVLATLAGNDMVNPDTFDAMAKDADASLNSINKQLDIQVPASGIQAFSIGGAEIAKLVIEHRRHSALVKVLTDNQPAIDSFSAKCIALLQILDRSLANDYNAKAEALVEAFSTIPHQNRTVDPKARAAVDELLQLNNDYLRLIQSLKSAKAVFEALPQGHRELLKSIQNQPTGLEAINRLYEEGKHLKAIYNTLRQPTSTDANKN